MRLFRLHIFFAALGISLSAMSAPIDEARKLYNAGDYEAAAAKARPLVKRSPRDGNANFFLGASLYALGNYDEAIAPLKVAEGRGVAEAARMLAEYSLETYKADEAREYLESWEALLKKGKKEIPESLAEMNSRAVQMQNMLERVERIEIIDSLTVSAADFFKAYRLSAQAGRLLPPDAVSRLGAGNDLDELSVAYMPENNSELLWSALVDGKYTLYGADILDDGTLDHTAPLDDALAGGGNAVFPFLMPDGMTLYFAADGEGSLGGYDIFMTRRTEADGGGKSFFQPQNMGMPYNSPANDYLLAIDETTGLGWWATDRNAEPGTLTIYVFAPSAVRVNVEPSDPNLASLARLDNIALTRREGVDYGALLDSRLEGIGDENEASTGVSAPRFALDMGNGKVYYRLADFTVESARSAMLEALAAEAALRKHLEKEQALRDSYAAGDHSVANAILASEKETASQRARILDRRNAAVRLETRR